MKAKGIHPPPGAKDPVPEQRMWELGHRRPPLWKRFLWGNPFRECEPQEANRILSSSTSSDSDTLTKPNSLDATASTPQVQPNPVEVMEANETESKEPLQQQQRVEEATPPETMEEPVYSMTEHWTRLSLAPPPPPPLTTPPLATPRFPKVPKAPSSPRVVPPLTQQTQRPSMDRNASISSTGSRHRRSSGEVFLVDTAAVIGAAAVPTTIVQAPTAVLRAISVLSDNDDDDDHIFDLSSDEEDNDALERAGSHEDAGSTSPTTVLTPPQQWMLEWADPTTAKSQEEEDINTTASCSSTTSSSKECTTTTVSATPLVQPEWSYCPLEPKVPPSSNEPVLFTVGWAALFLETDVTQTVGQVQLPSSSYHSYVHYIELLRNGTLRCTNAKNEVLELALTWPPQWSHPTVRPRAAGDCLALEYKIKKDDEKEERHGVCYILPVPVSPEHDLERWPKGTTLEETRPWPDDDYAPPAQHEAVCFMRLAMDAAWRASQLAR